MTTVVLSLHVLFYIPSEILKIIFILTEINLYFLSHFLQEDAKLHNQAAVESGALPMTHEDSKKWFYRDPQGEVQGPFLSSEMAEWFSAGYFTMNLLVKRGCDERFQPLGECTYKMYTKVVRYRWMTNYIIPHNLTL